MTVSRKIEHGQHEYMQYQLPIIDDYMLRKSVEAHNDGRSLSSIQDTLLGHADDGKEAVDIVGKKYNMLLDDGELDPMIWYRIPYRP